MLRSAGRYVWMMRWIFGLLAAVRCTLGPKAEHADTSGTGSTGGSSGGSSGDSTAMNCDEPTAGMFPAEGDPIPPGDIGETDTEGDDCNADSWIAGPPEEPGFHERLDAWDQDGLIPVECPNQGGSCSDEPIEDLVSALVVRNDALPLPRDFVTDGARWLVLSNVPLCCEDPFGAPLCAGQWRASYAVSSGTWCHEFLEFGWGVDYYAQHGSPFILEVGDSDCVTSAFTILDELNNAIYARFHAEEGTPYFAPMHGELCSSCELPAGNLRVDGSFKASICPDGA